MLKHFILTALLAALCLPAFAVEEHHGFVTGTVTKVDAAGKTVVVKLADGTQHTFHFVKRTAVVGGQATAAGSKEAFQGLKEGSQVAVHYTEKGGQETAEEFDDIGKGGIKAADVTVTHIDRGAKTIAVKTEDGTEETYRMTDNAAKDAGQDIAEGAEKAGKTTVYYTEEGGKKVVHFFKKTF
jgi:hypothetical protein